METNVWGWFFRAAASVAFVGAILHVSRMTDIHKHDAVTPIFGMLQDPSEPQSAGSLVEIGGQLMVRIE
jgi:hypothetical protein